jgi:hypothetical protein
MVQLKIRNPLIEKFVKQLSPSLSDCLEIKTTCGNGVAYKGTWTNVSEKRV